MAISASLLVGSSHAKAYSNNNLLDDGVFDNSTTMTTADIQNFLNRFPSSCLKNYSTSYPNDYFSYSGSVSAATVIRRAADLWGVNPQVIITKLQQEESLIDGSAGCENWRYNSAMGYNCPDSTGCNAGYAGFSQQVTKGTFQLKFNKEVSTGNANWQGNGDIGYGGYMTTGTRKRCNTCQSVYYDGYYTIDGFQIHIDTGATAALYSYTPHVPSSFPSIFGQWFGGDYSFVSANVGYGTLQPNQTFTATIKLQNTGYNTWYSDGNVPAGFKPMRLATKNYVGTDFADKTDPGWLGTNNQVKLAEASVAPGQTGTFTFRLRGVFYRSTQSLNFIPVVDGQYFLNNYVPSTSVSSPPASNRYSFVSAQNPPSTMLPGQIYKSKVYLKNAGNTIWRNNLNNGGVIGSVRLGVVRPYYGASPFYNQADIAWLSPSQVDMITPYVLPGGIGEFDFDIKAPINTGSYSMNFAPVVDGVAWMTDVGMGFSTTVTNR